MLNALKNIFQALYYYPIENQLFLECFKIRRFYYKLKFISFISTLIDKLWCQTKSDSNKRKLHCSNR
jgi:hypothetical protein